MKLIGLCSWAPGSGKTTVADIISRLHPDQLVLRPSFAGPLRTMLRGLLVEAGYKHAEAVDALTCYKHLPLGLLPGAPTPRELMRTLGTEWGRQLIHPNIWVGIMERKIQAAGPDDVVIIDDVRFPDEFALIRRLGGTVAAIRRKAAEDLLSLEQRRHVSDMAPDMTSVGVLIKNDQGLQELEQQVVSLVREGVL